MHDLMSQLAATPLFKGVPLENVADQLKGWCRVYHDRQTLFRQGDASTSLCILLSGSVRIVTDQAHISLRQAPEVIGELAIAGGPLVRTGTAFAMGTVQAIEVPLTVAKSMLSDIVFSHNLLAILAGKLAQSTAERATRYLNEERLIGAFDSHLSPLLTAQLLATGQDYGTPRQITGTVLFADIRGFTTTSQQVEPALLATELSDYLEEMVETLHRYGAFVDKFIGDAVMAFWGMEGASASDPSTAFVCAEEMIARASLKFLGGQTVAVGVGIARGNIFCGNVGNDQKRQFTVLGPAVNLAARCESYCKDLEANIVVPKEIWDALTSEQMRKCQISEGYMVRGVGNIDLYSRPLLTLNRS